MKDSNLPKTPRLTLLLLAALALSATRLWAADFEVRNGMVRLEEGIYVLDATIEYRFTDAVLEALEQGVPLVVQVHLQIRRKGAWVWEKDVVEQRLRHAIRYRALTSLYEVEDQTQGTRQHFITRDAALAALGEIRTLPIITRDQLDQTESYILELRADLDIEALPLPLRPQAYLSPAWKLSTGWISWPLVP